MKICFYTTGDIKFIATMKRALGMADPLSKLGWDVVIIAKDTPENRKRIELEVNLGEVLYYDTDNALFEVITKWYLVYKIKPDVIWICAMVFRNFLIYNKGKVLIEHSELRSAISYEKGIKKQLAKFFERKSVNCSGLVCASKYLENYFRQMAKSLTINIPIHYSPYAYNADVINMPAKILDPLRKTYPKGKKFVYMGTLTKNYGLFVMLEAAKMLKENGYIFQLFLLGRGRHKDDAEHFINEYNLNDCIILTDYVDEDNLSSYFSLADAFISPLDDTIQDWARCPSKIYMYLPYQKPILTCEIGEPIEIFSDDGLYFDFNSSNSLMELMRKICDGFVFDSTVNLGEHSWDIRASQFDQWYKNAFIK